MASVPVKIMARDYGIEQRRKGRRREKEEEEKGMSVKDDGDRAARKTAHAQMGASCGRS